MPKKYEERSLIEFQQEFPDSEACGRHLVRQRWPDGFVCPRCGHKEAWYLSKRQLFDCKICRFQTSVTAGTIFHGTQISKRVLLAHMARTFEFRMVQQKEDGHVIAFLSDEDRRC